MRNINSTLLSCGILPSFVLAFSACTGQLGTGDDSQDAAQVKSVSQAVLDDPDGLLTPDFGGTIPPELVQLAGYLKSAYPVFSALLSFLDQGPTLAQQLDMARVEIINEIRRTNVQGLEADVTALIDDYNLIARNPTNELVRGLYTDWLTESSRVMQEVRSTIASPDVHGAYNLILPLNTLGAMRLTMLRGSQAIGVMPFDDQSVLDLVTELKQTNYELVGSKLAFFEGNPWSRINSTHDSALWKSDLFAAASGAGACVSTVPVQSGGFLTCDLVTQTCPIVRCVPGTASASGCVSPTTCLAQKTARVDAKFDADSTVGMVRQFTETLIRVNPGTFEDRVHHGMLRAGVRVPRFYTAPISVASLGNRIDVAFEASTVQLRHMSWVGDQPGTLGGSATDFMSGTPSTRFVGSDRFWALYGNLNPSNLSQVVPTELLKYEIQGVDAPLTGLRGFPVRSGQPLGVPPGGFVDSPSVAPTNSIFAVVTGLDRAPWVNYSDGVNWSGWGPRPGFLQSEPIVISRQPGIIDYFAVSVDGSLEHGWNNGRESLGGTIGGLAVTTWGPDRIDVFGVAPDLSIQHQYYNGLGWSGWHSLGRKGSERGERHLLGPRAPGRVRARIGCCALAFLVQRTGV